MPSHKNFLDNLRSKPESTRNIIAATFALLPALLIGYGQFYMQSRQDVQKVAVGQESSQSEVSAVSAVASLGKIFEEGKDSIGSAMDNFKKIDKEFLGDGMQKQIETETAFQNENISTNTPKTIEPTNVNE